MSQPEATVAPELDDAARRRGVEAVLFLADEPVEVAALAEVLDSPVEAVTSLLEGLRDEYLEAGRGIEIREVAGGWRMYTAGLARPVVERWALAGRTGRLTQAALETLAVVAYKQPIGRQQISDIRGVNADGAVRSLVARGFVEEAGRDTGPGQAVLYRTTRTLLERLGLQSLDELPPLTDYLPEAPAPDEPELGALKEVRRRLAAGLDATGASIGGRSAAQTNTGATGGAPGDDPDEDEDDDALPPPDAARAGRPGDMDELTDRLESAARSAMDRLRAVVDANAARDQADGLDDDPGGPDPHAPDDPDEPGPTDDPVTTDDAQGTGHA